MKKTGAVGRAKIAEMMAEGWKHPGGRPRKLRPGDRQPPHVKTAIDWSAQPWPWCLIGPEFAESIKGI